MGDYEHLKNHALWLDSNTRQEASILVHNWGVLSGPHIFETNVYLLYKQSFKLYNQIIDGWTRMKTNGFEWVILYAADLKLLMDLMSNNICLKFSEFSQANIWQA